MTPDELARLAAAAPGRVWVGLDFDGTLSPHVGDPGAAALLPAARSALAALAAHPRAAVAVISGRAAAAVAERVPIPGIYFAGNHGLEFRAGEWSDRDPAAARAVRDIADFAAALAPRLAAVPRAFQDVKTYTVSVDARLVDAARREDVFALADEVARAFPRLEVCRAAFGSDVRPRGAGHKGTAAVKLRDLQAGPGAAAVFVGDDRTDEDAFAALPGGLTIKVGDGPTAAAHRLPDPHAVAAFLHALAGRL